jgi:hypothetical protein
LHGPALRQAVALAQIDTSGALVAVMTELLTNIQALDKSVTLLAHRISTPSAAVDADKMPAESVLKRD